MTIFVWLLAATLLLCLLCLARPALILVVTLVVFLLPLTIFSFGPIRLLLPVLLVPLTLYSFREHTRLKGGPVAGAMALLALVSLISVAWSESRQETLIAAAATLAVTALVVLLNSQISSDLLIKVMRFFALVVIGICLLYAFMPVGVLAGRVRGIFSNPNGLAAFVVVVLPLFTRGWWRVSGLCALGLVLMSGSRAGAVACLAELAVILVGGTISRTRRRVLVSGFTGLAIMIGMLSLHEPAQPTTATAPEESVIRFENSRLQFWQEAIERWQEAPLLGVGADALQVNAASSYLHSLASLGLIGVVTVAPLFILLTSRIISGDVRIAALASGALVNSIFESWLFTAGSLYFLILWLQIANSLKAESASPERRGPDESNAVSADRNAPARI